MAGKDRKIDPITRDYIPDGAGGWEYTRDASTAIYHQVEGELDGWVGDPEAGSRFHTLARAKSSIRTPAVILDIAKAALKPLVDAGLISEPTTIVERDRSRAVSQTVVTDLQTGEELDLTDLLSLNV